MYDSDVIIPAGPYVQLAKSGPYRNTSRAVAELIDNSADAKATEIGICPGGRQKPPPTPHHRVYVSIVR